MARMSSIERPSSGDVRVREAVPADAAAMGHVRHASWQAAYSGLMPADYLAGLSVDGFVLSARRMLAAHADGRISVFVAEVGGVVAGFAAVGPSRDDDADDAGERGRSEGVGGGVAASGSGSGAGQGSGSGSRDGAGSRAGTAGGGSGGRGAGAGPGVGMGPRGDRRGDAVGELLAIYLDPAVWGLGIGRRLQSVALQRLREDGYTEATLWVLAGNTDSRAFYERTGWRADGGTSEFEAGAEVLDEARYRRAL
jgi:GNAT superfamily N-acetyltransferase